MERYTVQIGLGGVGIREADITGIALITCFEPTT